jgi:hypothetical protein
MECKILTGVGYSYPREVFIQKITEKFEKSETLKDDFNDWQHKSMISSEKDLVKKYSSLVRHPRLQAPPILQPNRDMLNNCRRRLTELQALEEIPDYLNAILIERGCGGLSDLRILRDFFAVLLKLKLKDPGYSLDISADGKRVYVTTGDDTNIFAKDDAYYSHEIPLEFVTKANLKIADAFVKLIDLPVENSILIVDHYDHRMFE